MSLVARKAPRERERIACARTIAAVLPVVLFLCGAVASEGSERSEVLYSRGLVPFHAERYGEALDLFEQAVLADPADARARFYRGVTRGRTGDIDGAVNDLRAALDLDPRFDEAALELGVALVQRGQYADAAPWLERAQREPRLEGHASLFLGIAQLRVGERELAGRSFARAADADAGLRVPATYYGGVIAFQESRWADARSRFEEVLRSETDTEMARESKRYLVAIGGRDRAYVLHARIGLEYDSNVALAPGDEAVNVDLGVSDEADGRVALSAGGEYRILSDEEVNLSLGYEFYQGLQFELTEFNLQDHRVHMAGIRRWEMFEVGGLVSYDYYLRETESFLQQVNVAPLVSLLLEDRSRTTLLYRYRWNDYFEEPFGELLDGNRHTMGFRQYFYLGSPSSFILGGYQYEIQDTSRAGGAAFAYDANVLEAGVGWVFPMDLALEAVYSYRRQDYAAASQGRVDDEHLGVLVLALPLTHHLTLAGTFFADVNESTQPQYTYDRYIGAISLEATY